MWSKLYWARDMLSLMNRKTLHNKSNRTSNTVNLLTLHPHSGETSCLFRDIKVCQMWKNEHIWLSLFPLNTHKSENKLWHSLGRKERKNSRNWDTAAQPRSRSAPQSPRELGTRGVRWRPVGEGEEWDWQLSGELLGPLSCSIQSGSYIAWISYSNGRQPGFIMETMNLRGSRIGPSSNKRRRERGAIPKKSRLNSLHTQWWTWLPTLHYTTTSSCILGRR